MINGYFTTISGHFFANCIFIFHKTEVQMVILMCLSGLKSDWFKGYNTKSKYFHFHFFAILCNENVVKKTWTSFKFTKLRPPWNLQQTIRNPLTYTFNVDYLLRYTKHRRAVDAAKSTLNARERRRQHWITD